MPSNTDAKARVVVAKSILQHLADLQYGTEEYTPEANQIREAYAELSKSALKGDSKAKSALGSAVRDWVTNPQSKVESRDSLSRAFDLGVVSLYPNVKVDLAKDKTPDSLARRLQENVTGSEIELQNIIKTAYLDVQKKFGDNHDEDFLGRALVVALKKYGYNSSSGTKKALGKLLGDLERVPDDEVTAWIFRLLDPMSIGDNERPSLEETKVDKGQPNPVSRRSISPSSPYSSDSNPTRDRPAVGLSESQELYGQLGALASGLDSVSLRHLVRQARELRGGGK